MCQMRFGDETSTTELFSGFLEEEEGDRDYVEVDCVKWDNVVSVSRSSSC